MKKTFIYILGLMFLLPGLTSCKDYLDKEPDSIISEKDAFKNFKNFQGFVERVTNTIPQPARSNWAASFNWGDDEVITIGKGDFMFGTSVDNGAYRDYMSNEASGNYSAFFRRNWNLNSGSYDAYYSKDLWGGGWFGIRTVNMGLQALADGKLIEATAEQRRFLEGQMYYWRAYFHFQISVYFGGLPYIDKVLPSDEPLREPRLTYREMAEKCIADMEKAVELLPVDWDKTTTGNPTKGNNTLRPNKIQALAMLGKIQLYAASPLMNVGAATGTYRDYDKDLCADAAETFGKLLSMVEKGETQYKLVDFENYSSLFYTRQQNWQMPGLTEAIIIPPLYGADSYWRQTNSYYPALMSDGDGMVFHPAANYVNFYGTADGLPLDDPNSTWSNTQPWKDRDPRFYHDIVYDGIQVVFGTITNSEEEKLWRYANLHTNGSYRNDPTASSRTGYICTKLIPPGTNRFDKAHDGWNNAVNLNPPLLRLAEIYLFYAEAAAQAYGGANGKASSYSKTAVDAINVIRARAGVGPVAETYTANLDKFMDEVRRERAVELAFEGHRFNDLRRWLLLTDSRFNKKTAHNFDRASALDTEADPKLNKVVNWEEVTIVQRKLDAKHYWIPFKTDDVTMYPEFYQNPGW